MAFIIGIECDKIFASPIMGDTWEQLTFENVQFVHSSSLLNLRTLERRSKVKVAKNLQCNSFPSAAVVVLSNVVVLKAGWTGIEQIEWPLVVTGSHSGNALPFQRAHACQPPHFLISNNRLPFSTNNRLLSLKQPHKKRNTPSFKWNNGLPLSYSFHFMWFSFNLAVKRPNLIKSHLSCKAEKLPNQRNCLFDNLIVLIW